jgi:hypothetical protein
LRLRGAWIREDSTAGEARLNMLVQDLTTSSGNGGKPYLLQLELIGMTMPIIEIPLSNSNSETGSSFSLLGGFPLYDTYPSYSTKIYYVGSSMKFSSSSKSQTFTNSYGFIMLG